MNHQPKHLALICIVLILLGLLLASCQKDPADVVTNALLTLSTSQYRMDLTTVLSDGLVRQSVMEFIPPDTKHILEASTGMEYIIIDQVVYAKYDASADWVKTQIPASVYLGEINQTAQSIADGMEDLVQLNADTLNGKSMRVYSYNSTTLTSGYELKNQTQLWIGKADGLLYKMHISGDIIASSQDASGQNDLSVQPAQTTTLITYNPPLQIVAPIP